MIKKQNEKNDSIRFKINKKTKENFFQKLLKKGYSGFTEFLNECIRNFMEKDKEQKDDKEDRDI